MYNEKVIYFGFVNKGMLNRKRIVSFVKNFLENTYVQKHEFKSFLKEFPKGKKEVSGFALTNSIQTLNIFPSTKRVVWKTPLGKENFEFNRLIFSPYIHGKKSRRHLLIETDPEAFLELEKHRILSEKRFLKRKYSTRTIIRISYKIPVSQKAPTLRSPSVVYVKVPKQESKEIINKVISLAYKQRNPHLRTHLEKLLREHEISEVLRRGFSIQDIMLFLPALKISTLKKQKVLDNILENYLNRK